MLGNRSAAESFSFGPLRRASAAQRARPHRGGIWSTTIRLARLRDQTP
jgi:hypothetical protein